MGSLTRPLHRLMRDAANWRHGLFAGSRATALRRFEALDEAAQAKYALDRLRHVLFFAYHTVPFYKRRFDALGVTPREVRTFGDLAALPLLSKDDVRLHGAELVSRSAARRRARADATGGSTGTPLGFVGSPEAAAMRLANERRMWRWYGAAAGDRLALIWGSDRDVAPAESARDLRNRLLGRRALNAFLLDEERCLAFARILERFDPVVVYGYATALARFARFLQRQGRPCRVRPRAIRSTAEVLSPEDRRLIERELHGPVFDYYGSRDAGCIAGECRAHAGLHVFSDVTHVEIVGDDGRPCAPGEVGEVVITKLHEHAMPFIRYRTGDRAAWLGRRCACGLALPLLSSLCGRRGDFVRTPAGQEIHGEFFSHLFYGVSGVARFQVRQTSRTSLQILVEAAGPPDPAALERVRSASAARFGARSLEDVELRIVDAIAPGPSGKHRFVLPYAAPDDGAAATTS